MKKVQIVTNAHTNQPHNKDGEGGATTKRVMISKSAQKKWNDLIADTYDLRNRCFSPTERFYNEEVRCKAIKTYCLAGNSLRILDIGCGTGCILSVFVPRFPQFHFVGLDISKRSLKQARKKVASSENGNADFVVADAELLPFASGTFDVALCIATLHHLPHPPSCLKEIHRVVKSEAHVFLDEPNVFAFMPYVWLYRKISGWLRPLKEEIPFELGFSLKELKNMLSEAKFTAAIDATRFLSAIPPLGKLADRNTLLRRVIFFVDKVFGQFPFLKIVTRTFCVQGEKLDKTSSR